MNAGDSSYDAFVRCFYRGEPEVLYDTECFSIVWKPHDMPSAPLRANEDGDLLSWYLRRPEAARPPGTACSVVGRKTVERGLLHRLDTATAGMLLIAKTQSAFDFLSAAQRTGRFRKTYRAFCVRDPSSSREPVVPVERSLASFVRRRFSEEGHPRQDPPPPDMKVAASFSTESRFRMFGPGRREVRPVFPGSRLWKTCGGRVYRTEIEIEGVSEDGKTVSVSCALNAGFRHQLRTHLAACGLPIYGDRLYNPLCRACVRRSHTDCPLRLFAVALSFPDPGGGPPVFFSLPPADKTTR